MRRINAGISIHDSRFLPGFCRVVVVWVMLTLSAAVTKAEVANPDEMANICQNWLTYIVAQTGAWAGSTSPYVVDYQDIIVNDTILARYFSVAPQGYIIVPVLKDMPPVKAYSDEYSLDIYEADGFALLLRQVLQHRTQLYAEVYGSLEASQPADGEPLFDRINHDKWDYLNVSPEQFAATNKAVMSPLDGVGPLLTTAWHQGSPYNNLCPQGDGGRCVVGCVATAAAQIMYYHQWPPMGQGSHAYYWSGDNSCQGNTTGGTLSADFSDPYAYDDSPQAVAEISYEMGIAFNMDYGYCGSGAYTLDGSFVFPTYFRYDTTTKQEYRENHTATTWFEHIKSDINKGFPILYRIYSHAIVCDGWRLSGDLMQYHFNYGWGGSQTAWYTVDNLHCPWSGCDPMVEGMVTGIIPQIGSPWLGSSVFDDHLGDNDGVLESGETVELAVTLANHGGAPVTDVTMNLTVDDASITIIDGNASLGTINAHDSIANSADPFVFEIPGDYLSRVDSFYIEITWDAGTRIDTQVVERTVGAALVLLVDDDDNAARDIYYREAFDNFRIPYDVWTHSYNYPPDSAYMAGYDIVVWFTGDYRQYPISSPEIAAIKSRLNGGGKLFLTGQAIAAELNSIDPGFLNNYLRSSYMGSSYLPALPSQSGQVFDTGFMVGLQGGNSASNQLYPDQIVPINGSVAELKYIGSQNFGGVSYAGDYTLVFLSFGFESAVSGDSRWRSRDSLLSDILGFFQYQKPNAAPAATGLAVSPGDYLHLLDHNPTFSWTFQDAEGASQAMYQIQAGTDNNWTAAEMWDSGPASGSAGQVVYAGLPLEDGHRYYFRVRVHDGSLWSDWLTGDLRLNSPPSAPTALAPAGMEGAASTNPVLTLTNGVDGENDPITYTFEVYADSLMTTLVDNVEGRTAGPSTTTWQVSVMLGEDMVYFWRARGRDAYEIGQWSAPATFWVNGTNQAPTTFDLVSPADGARLSHRQPTLTWAMSTDPDPYDNVEYTLYYSTDSTFATGKVTVSDLMTTSYAMPAPLDFGNTYYWKVRANDAFTGQTYSLRTCSFRTIPQGDANGDGSINIGDAIFVINYIFNNGPAPSPVDAGDANCDGNPNVGDAILIVNYVFKGGIEPGC